jgi:acyl-CoA synthetase (AMP-forming)/AMP-acid ligase II
MQQPVAPPLTATPAANSVHGLRLHPGPSGGISLYDLLAAQALRDTSAPAIFALGRAPLDFGGLLDQIDDVRTTLNDWGLGRGDRIAVLGARGPETAVALLGIACCATCVPLNSAAPVAELQRGLIETGAKALLVPTSVPGEVEELARRLGIVL